VNEYKRSISYPELRITKDCKFYHTDFDYIEREVPLLLKHSYSTNGPVVYYRHGKKTRSLSARALFFEAWIKEGKITKNDSHEPIDGDYYNLNIDNFMGKKRNKEGLIQIRHPEGSDYSWMNGNDGVYL